MSRDVLHCKLFFPMRTVCALYVPVLYCVSKLLIASVLLLKCFPEFIEYPYLEKLYFWRGNVYQFF